MQFYKVQLYSPQSHTLLVVGGYVGLQSNKFPGQRVGVSEKSVVKRPSTVGTRKRGHFTPIVKGW